MDIHPICHNHKAAMFRRIETLVVAVAATVVLGGCTTISSFHHDRYSQFIGLTKFNRFSATPGTNGEVVLVSPKIKTSSRWNELVVSWNTTAPAGSYLKVEARAILPDHTTKFYSLGAWASDEQAFARHSVSGQSDADGDVRTDTLTLAQPATATQIRVTLGGAGALPSLKFLGLSFCNTNVIPEHRAPNHAAWGKVIPVVERSQQSYAGGNGWCSPTSVSMALAHWGTVSNCPSWAVDAPEVAAGAIDHNFKKATGNWSFNTAFAGSRPGMRAYVTRFEDISELEEWIAAGIPVVISARYDLLLDGRADDFNGHLTVCRGFTEDGDLIINDPWTDPKVESIRHVYKRANVRRAWATSHNTVYLIYPENLTVPPDHFGHWFVNSQSD